MPGKYAQDTEVAPDRSRAEIERTLVRYGATAFAYGWEGSSASVMFKIKARSVRIRLPLPARDSAEFTKYQPGDTTYSRSEEQARKLYDQAVRQKWRALALVVKAKLEAVEAGISTLEAEFLADTLLPSGQTVGEWALPQVQVALQAGRMPPLLPGAGETTR